MKVVFKRVGNFFETILSVSYKHKTPEPRGLSGRSHGHGSIGSEHVHRRRPTPHRSPPDYKQLNKFVF